MRNYMLQNRAMKWHEEEKMSDKVKTTTDYGERTTG
jgi:hypothetical protein